MTSEILGSTPIIICLKCGEKKRSRALGMCKTCYSKEYYKENKERITARRRERYKNDKDFRKKMKDNAQQFREKNPDYINEYYQNNRKKWRERARRLRDECWMAYGGKCQHCGISDSDVLSIDHINGRTPEDDFKSKQLWSYLKKNNWPKDKYQLLCRNCNWKKRLESND